MKYKTISLSLAFLLIFLFPGLAKAQTNKQDRVNNRCEMIESRIDFRLNGAEQNGDKYNNRYLGVRKKLVDLTNKLAEKGCAVNEVQNDLIAFNGLIEDFAAAQRMFITSLQNSRGYACGQSEGQFATAVNTSRQNLLTVRTKALAVKNFYKNTLHPDVKAMGEACRANRKGIEQ